MEDCCTWRFLTTWPRSVSPHPPKLYRCTRLPGVNQVLLSCRRVCVEYVDYVCHHPETSVTVSYCRPTNDLFSYLNPSAA
jgi:hypothetical protein